MVIELLKLDKRPALADTEPMQPNDALQAVTHADPFGYYRTLRDTQPLYFDATLNLWVASSHAAVSAALQHPALRVRPTAEPVPHALLGTPAGDVFAQLVRMTDGEFHARHKPAVEQALQRWSAADVVRASEAATADLRPRVAANRLLWALPVQTMARLLGVPPQSLDPTCEWVLQFTQGIAAGASAQAVSDAGDGASALMAQGLAQGLSSPAAANRIALMQQSLDACAGLLGHTACMLLREPQHAQQADVSLAHMRAFVAEVERWCAPIQNTRRFAAQDLTLGGQTVTQGQGVLVVLASANRDGAFNPDPDAFDPARENRRSMGFGEGLHACPGKWVAIEMIAAHARQMRACGQFDSYFGSVMGFRPLANARVPVFAHGAQAF